jgi:Flp pilus assembly protein TadD
MPTNEELYDAAISLKDSGQLEEAVAKLEDLLRQDPAYALAHSALAVLFTKLKRHDEAIAHAQRVCQLEPKDAFSFTALSVTLQRAGKIPEAEDAMARARMLQGGGH